MELTVQRYPHREFLHVFPAEPLRGRDSLENGQNWEDGEVPAMVLLPTPPLALATAMTFETSRILCFGGRPLVRFGIVPVLGSASHQHVGK